MPVLSNQNSVQVTKVPKFSQISASVRSGVIALAFNGYTYEVTTTIKNSWHKKNLFMADRRI
ncbi:MAG: hypothetical protein ACLQO7_09720 [Candidatus Bathyarchaeia archaeon]